MVYNCKQRDLPKVNAIWYFLREISDSATPLTGIFYSTRAWRFSWPMFGRFHLLRAAGLLLAQQCNQQQTQRGFPRTVVGEECSSGIALAVRHGRRHIRILGAQGYVATATLTTLTHNLSLCKVHNIMRLCVNEYNM